MKLFNFKYYPTRWIGMAAIVAILSGCDGLDLQKLNSQPTTDATSAKIKNPSLSSLSPKEMLGKKIFNDMNLSEPRGFQSCASCHAASQGFAGFGDVAPGGFPRGFVAGFAEGAVAGMFGGRKAPSAAYSTFSPVLAYTKAADGGGDRELIGGLFWDGRASGLRLNSPAAEQALGPFLNPVEQNHPSAAAVLEKIKQDPTYETMWQSAWGASLSTSTAAEISANYDRVGLSIAAYEASKEVSPFSSKYDAYVAGKAKLTVQELEGLTLFNGDADCYECHAIKNTKGKALFTDHGFDNLGLPASSSEFAKKPDYGLRDFLLTLGPSNPWYSLADEYSGKFRTPTLRNVAKGTNRRYMHNGVFSSLEEVVHFYNTRDVRGEGWNGVPWGAPEIPATMERKKLGDLRLTPTQEAAIVAFMKTLDDGWVAN